MNLFGNPYNLQGSSNPLQGSAQVLQGGALPTYGPPVPAPVQRYTAPVKRTAVKPAPAPIVPTTPAVPTMEPGLDATRAGIPAGQPNSPWVTAQTTPTASASTTATPQLSSYIDPIRSYYESLNRTQPTEADNQMIKENIRKDMQASIDAINAQYSNLVSQQNSVNQDNQGQTRAMNARSGLIGSDFGQAKEMKTKEYGTQALKGLENEKTLMLTQMNDKIMQRADAEIKARKEEALGNQEAYQSFIESSRNEAKQEMALMAQKGVKLENLPPEQRNKLFEQAGYDPAWGELIYNAQKPKASQIDYKFEKMGDGVGFFYGVDPETGELKQQKVNVDIPADFKLQITDDGTPLIFNPKTGEAQVASGFGEGQFRKPFASEMGGESSGNSGLNLTPGQINTTVNQIAGQFDNEPIVRAYNTVSQQVNALKTLGNSPTDDQARIYSFAKVMDPNSAVREGEYKTVQQYSTALLQRYGLNTKRVFDNSGILTSEARAFIKSTLDNTYKSHKAQYDNVASEYQRQINDTMTGKPRQITNYSGSFESPSVDLNDLF